MGPLRTEILMVLIVLATFQTVSICQIYGRLLGACAKNGGPRVICE